MIALSCMRAPPGRSYDAERACGEDAQQGATEARRDASLAKRLAVMKHLKQKNGSATAADPHETTPKRQALRGTHRRPPYNHDSLRVRFQNTFFPVAHSPLLIHFEEQRGGLRAAKWDLTRWPTPIECAFKDQKVRHMPWFFNCLYSTSRVAL